MDDTKTIIKQYLCEIEIEGESDSLHPYFFIVELERTIHEFLVQRGLKVHELKVQ